MFTVTSEEIDRLDGKALVELLRALVHAEARSAGIPMSGIDVPLQVTIADGGEDGSVVWKKGKTRTAFLPCRDVVFQCKATDHGDAQWKREVWTKKTQAADIDEKELSAAIARALKRRAAYIGVTGSPRVKEKIAAREQAIRDGIVQAGGDPMRLAAVHIYDGNKLEAWVNAHPAVALWVREREAGFALSTFGSFERWGKRNVLTTPPFVPVPHREFALGTAANERIRFDQLGRRLLEHLVAPGACVRLWGRSGLGKTRALYEALLTGPSRLLAISRAHFIFCDWRESSGHVFDVAHQLKNAGHDAILVVDSCPFEEAGMLVALAREDGSRLRIVTLGTEGRHKADDCLMIQALPDDATTLAMLEARLPGISEPERELLARQTAGYPAHASLIASGDTDSWGTSGSINLIAERLIAERITDPDTIRALELLALFDGLAPDRDPADFDALCQTFLQMKGERVYAHLIDAAQQQLVERDQDRMEVAMDFIANVLALRRLAHLRRSTLQTFLTTAKPALRDAMLARWQTLGERSPTAVQVVRAIVTRGWMRTDQVLSEEAAPYLIGFVHADPTTMLQALGSAIFPKSLDELAQIDLNGPVQEALRLLASLPRTFPHAVPLVVKLAAASDLAPDTPIVRLLRQLFQIALSGTGADERRRRLALSEALDDSDPRMRRACIEALGAMLTTQMTRFGDVVQIGDEPVVEWHPSDHGQILGYFRWALQKLLGLWRAEPDHRARIEAIVADDLRMLVEFEVLDLVEAFAGEIVAARGHWFEGTRGIGDWLYYDRPADWDDHARAIRALYDRMLPADPVDQLLLCTLYWSTDLHDPDIRYADTEDNPDFDYPSRRAQALTPIIAADPALLGRAIDVMACTETNTPYPFAEALAPLLSDPLATFRRAVAVLDSKETRDGIGFVRALLNALDRRFADDAGQNDALVAIAQTSRTLAADSMAIFTALRMTDLRVREIAARIRAGNFDLPRVVQISYGRGLDETPTLVLAELVDALIGRYEDGGAWAALEILNMVVHGKTEVSPDVLTLIKRTILAPAIAQGPVGHAGHAEYGLEQLIKRLHRAHEIDAAFARGFAEQIVRACQSSNGSLRMSEVLRKALVPIVETEPLAIWDVISVFHDQATRFERDRLTRILAPAQSFMADASRTQGGLLARTPEPVLLDWVAHDPDTRLDFLLSFYPVLEQDAGAWVWAPALERLADRYGALPAFRAGLRLRIFVRSYAGSLEEHLRRFLAPLAAWEDHPALGEWSERMRTDLDGWLEDERQPG